MADKEAFLNRLAAKLGRERIHQTEDPKWLRHPWDHLHKDLDQAGLVTQFANELMKLGGIVIPVREESELPAAIESYLRENEFTKLIAWPPSNGADAPSHPAKHHPSSTTDPAVYLQDRGFEVTYWQKDGDRDSLIRTAETSEAGLVYASHGLSETGSIVLYNGGDKGRLVSLLPNQFMAVLHASTVVPRITQLLAQMGPRAREHACINIITGPSRTSDIEMDLTIGVHGPGRITVFLIEDHL